MLLILIALTCIVMFAAGVATGWYFTSGGNPKRDPYEVYAEMVIEANKHWEVDPSRAMALSSAADKMLERALIDAPELMHNGQRNNPPRKLS